jgi:dihydroflavonol-4-reductase
MSGVRRLFHVAADYRLWTLAPEELYKSNVEGTRSLFEAAARAGVERVVYTSTVATIAVPQHGERPPNEETLASLDQMIGHYKRSKFLAERQAVEFASAGLPVVIVNPTAPVGPGDWKPTPTGRIIVDFLNGKMPAYVDTGLNLVAVEDVAAGHLLAAERGRVGERYILGARNMTLKQILDALAAITGRSAPRIRLPHAVALAAGYADEWFSRLTRREPQIPVEGVKMSRHRMFVESDKAQKELGYAPGSVEAALERAVRWYQERGYFHGRTLIKSVPHPQAA